MNRMATALHTEIGPHLRRGAPPLLIAIFLSSFAALLLELSLTRLFSVVLFYHFAFLAISVALLILFAAAVKSAAAKARHATESGRARMPPKR
jgi:hypothetical protein